MFFFKFYINGKRAAETGSETHCFSVNFSVKALKVSDPGVKFPNKDCVLFKTHFYYMYSYIYIYSHIYIYIHV